MSPPSTDDRLIEQLAASLREQDEVVESGTSPLREQLFEMMEASRPPTTTLAANNSPRRWMVAVGVTLAAAAAVTLVVWGLSEQHPDHEELPRVALTPIPDYKFTTDGGLALQRSDTAPSGGLQYKADNQFTWKGRPATKVGATVDVRVCATSASGEVIPINVDPFLTIDPTSGAIQLQGRIAALPLSPGDWKIAIAVGHPQVLAEIASVCGASRAEGLDVDLIEMRLLED